MSGLGVPPSLGQQPPAPPVTSAGESCHHPFLFKTKSDIFIFFSGSRRLRRRPAWLRPERSWYRPASLSNQPAWPWHRPIPVSCSFSQTERDLQIRSTVAGLLDELVGSVSQPQPTTHSKTHETRQDNFFLQSGSKVPLGAGLIRRGVQ